jgi:hypothetical protein
VEADSSFDVRFGLTGGPPFDPQFVPAKGRANSPHPGNCARKIQMAPRSIAGVDAFLVNNSIANRA